MREHRSVASWAGLAALVAAALPAGVRAQGAGQEVTGVAPVQEQDPVRAREQALGDAMTRALEQAVLQAAPEVRGRQYLVSGRARQYVTSYRVLEEGAAGGQYQVRISAQIDLPRLLRDLQPSAAQQRPRAPRPSAYLLCGVEPGRLELPLPGPVLPPSACAGAGSAEALPAEITRHKAAAGLFVRVSDTAPAEALRGLDPPLFGAAARVVLTLLGPEGRRGEEAAETWGFGATAEAAQRAATAAAAQAALGALKLPPKAAEVEGAGAILLTFEGLSGYADWQQALQTVAALPGVSAVEPRRFQGGLATVLVRGAAEPAQLAATLGRTPMGRLQVQVKPPQGQELRVLVAPPEEPAQPQP